MRSVRAIPTRAFGRRFRSRLEARWAVFFEARGVKWDYEPEGFRLSCGRWYLPDFHLPSYRLYVEIKPREVSEPDRVLMAQFRDEVGTIMLLNGPPGDERLELFSNNGGIVLEPSGLRGSHQRYRAAVEAALSARFEHGERP